MKIVVTGGAGFLGSHLVDSLLQNGNEVISIDNFYTGSKNNFSHNLNNSSFTFLEHNVTEPIEVECDQIFNLACPASPKHYQLNPIETFKTSVLGAMNLLEMGKKNKARMFQASTSEIYGDPKEHPQKETYWGNVNPIGPRSCYDEGKRAAETLFFDYKRKYNLDIRVARIFNTFGPRMSLDDGRVVSNFIVQCLKNEPLSIYGKGDQTRSFCYVEDLIEGFIKIMKSDNSSLNESPLNIGNPEEFTILELATMIKELTSSESKLSFYELPDDDPVMRKPDISSVTEKIDWFPKTKLKDGLLKTIEYFDNLLSTNISKTY